MAMIENTRVLHASCAPARSALSLRSLLTLWQSRQALRSLDDAALQDIGISAQEAHSESRRAFWDVPATWRA